MMLRALLFALLITCALPVQAQEQPLEITADNFLEWNRNTQKFIANKNAIAKQGETELAAQTLTADYRSNSDNDFEIWQIKADGQVEISAQDSTASGDNAVYNLDDGLAIMTGENLKLVSPDQTVTAQERFEYWVEDGRLVAIGKAKATRLDDTLEADEIAATFKENAQGDRVLDFLEAKGNVIIITPKERLTGDYGIYRSNTNLAEVKGNVKIRRGPNVLEGDRAEVDLTTNISKMYGASGTQGRVRGVFYPGTGDSP